jgi:hypothetical protein
MSNTPARTAVSHWYTAIRFTKTPAGPLWPDTVNNRREGLPTRRELTKQQAAPLADLLVQLSELEARSRSATLTEGALE